MTVRIDNLTRTWANSSQTHIGLGLNVNADSYGANSKVFSLKTNGDEVFDIGPNGSFKVKPNTVNSLTSISVGLRSFVTDSANNTWGSTVKYGGSNNVPVYCNGTHWLVG
jgi:hypothetical protein